MYLKLGYLGLSVLITTFIFLLGNRAINACQDPRKSTKKIILGLGLFFWNTYVYLVAISGVIQSFELPPKFPILLVLPTFVFIAIFLYSNKDKKWIDSIPKHWLIYIQSFRLVVETLFVISVSDGLLHYHVTIEGYNYDMLVGFSALIIGFLFHKKWVSENFVLYWNYTGLSVLAVVVFVFITTAFFPTLYGSKVSLMPLEALKYPFVLVASFLMPVAVFLHIWSILQLRKG
tara:strand:- start:722 stop:1417 length:696 start_codon:yes stop_codon:yes gene_type:complete